jgi:hypothetical protein
MPNEIALGNLGKWWWIFRELIPWDQAASRLRGHIAIRQPMATASGLGEFEEQGGGLGVRH